MGFIEKKRWLFLGLPFTFTTYSIEEEKITIKQGFFNTSEDSLYMYKVLDVKLERSFMERLSGLGTVVCYTGDVTDKVLKLNHIKHSKQVNDYIFTTSEEMRKKRRTINTQNLTNGFGDLSDMNDIDDVNN